MTERWTDETLDRFASTVVTAITANNEAIAASNERLTRIEQLVESNNRFLEAFTQRVDRLAEKVDRLTDNTDRVIQQMAASTSNANQERMDVTTRLSAINRKVEAIASHLGVSQ
jgi:response regulator RpfG family c-di-GMP phosphodiesterase